MLKICVVWAVNIEYMQRFSLWIFSIRVKILKTLIWMVNLNLINMCVTKDSNVPMGGRDKDYDIEIRSGDYNSH